ncbi:hypothetical protein R5H30_07715 [Sulfitobacter sp. D35]|uniref:hypothetical protein n=1 Tax=Sulfitobacter sp. D35 TaxID=3083252 RepID=UPI00296F759A|nr:hypothetical protein [Sulfitobacter sp. D35]MDW4497861.1 hypothetical protein [Sulfitobacter sp. D35]
MELNLTLGLKVQRVGFSRRRPTVCNGTIDLDQKAAESVQVEPGDVVDVPCSSGAGLDDLLGGLRDETLLGEKTWVVTGVESGCVQDCLHPSIDIIFYAIIGARAVASGVGWLANL